MGELYNPYPKLPRNIRQIGEKDDTAKLYMEDYVSTYLRGLLPAGEEGLRVGVLLGNMEVREGVPFLFLDGAMELEDMSAVVGNVEFTEAVWKKAYQDMEQMFPKRTIQGWFLCGAKGSQLNHVDYWKAHGQYFAGKYKLMYLNSGEEGEEEVYIAGEEGLNQLNGYCIYYERNQMMQDYMIIRNDSKRVDSGAHDRVTRDFKDRMAERKGQIQSQKSMVRMLAGACGALSVAVLAGGIVMFNNYSQMRQMQSVIASVLPEGSVLSDKEEWNGEVEIQMAAGGVYPTQAGMEDETGVESVRTEGTQDGAIGSEMESLEVELSEGGETSDAKNQETKRSDMLESDKIKSSNIESAKTEQISGAETTDSKANDSNQTDKKESVKKDSDKKDSDKKDSDKIDSAKKGQTSDRVQGGNQTAAEADSGLWEMKDAVSGETLRYYTVGDGETLYGICYKLYHNLSNIDKIIELNGLESQDKIIAGQKLQLP